MDNILMNALEELINKCDGNEPYYCDSHNDSFIQCALVDEDADSPVMYVFIGITVIRLVAVTFVNKFFKSIH